MKHKDATKTPSECQRACVILNLLEQVIHVAGTSAELHAKMLASSPDNNREAEADCLPPPPVNWSHVMGFIPLVVFALNKWKVEVVGLTDEIADTVLVKLKMFFFCFYFESSYILGIQLTQNLSNLVKVLIPPETQWLQIPTLSSISVAHPKPQNLGQGEAQKY